MKQLNDMMTQIEDIEDDEFDNFKKNHCYTKIVIKN